MSWVGALIGALGSIGGGAMGAAGSKRAAEIQARVAQQQLELQRRIYNSQLGNQEPFRATGLGANNLLARLYGLPYYDYSPAQGISGYGVTGTSQVTGGRNDRGGAIGDIADQFGIGGSLRDLFGSDRYTFRQRSDGTIEVNGRNGGRGQVGGTIDPRTGQFTANNDPGNYSEQINNYLATGQWEGERPDSVRRVLNAIDALRDTGWTPSEVETVPGTTGGTEPGYHEGTGEGDLSVFQESPGYQFRLNEGLRAVTNSAAARGGLGSGDSLRAVNDYSQGTASEDFYNFVNQMNNMAGRGQTAVSDQNSAGNMFSIGASNALGNYGDARASGVANAYNMWGQGIQGAGNAFADYWSNRNRNTPSAPNSGTINPYAIDFSPRSYNWNWNQGAR